MTICVRAIDADELAWVNQQYQAIGFVPTESGDRQFIAEVEHQHAGIGRLAYIAESVWELGGIYVLPQFRGKSVARAIVQYLLLQAKNVHLYCIPFANLGEFYKSIGFAECSVTPAIPEKISKKYQWCQQNYVQEVLLLELAPASEDCS